MSNPRVEAPYALTIPTSLGGANKDTYDMMSLWVQAGWPKDDDTTFPPFDTRNAPTVIEVEAWYLDLDGVFLWCDEIAKLGQPGDILNYQAAWHELADITKICPYDETQTETWETWGTFGESHKPQFNEATGFWYRSMRVGQSGTPLPCSAWYDYVRNPKTQQTGINDMISQWEYQNLPQPEPTTIRGIEAANIEAVECLRRTLPPREICRRTGTPIQFCFCPKHREGKLPSPKSLLDK